MNGRGQKRTADEDVVCIRKKLKIGVNVTLEDPSGVFNGLPPGTHMHTASEITDFDTEVSNNATVTGHLADTGDPHDTLNSAIIVSKGATDSLVQPFDAGYRMVVRTKDSSASVTLDETFGGATPDGAVILNSTNRQAFDTGQNTRSYVVCSGATDYMVLDSTPASEVLSITNADLDISGVNVDVGSMTVGGTAAYLLEEKEETSNLVAGSGAGSALIPGATKNVFIGKDAGSSTTGDNCVMMGYFAGKAATGSDLVAIGNEAKSVGVGGGSGVYVGALAGKNATGNRNTMLGYAACGTGTASGGNNVVIGSYAGANVAAATGVVVIGDGAGDGITSGSNNTAVGFDSLNTVTTGNNNTGLGANTAVSALANYQIALGAGATCTQASQMTIGAAATQVVTEIRPGTDNACTLGSATNNRFSTVYCNAVDTNGGLVDGVDVATLAVGTQGFTNPVDDTNMAAGTGAGGATTSGSNGVFIGKNAGALLDHDNCTIIGYDAGKALASAAGLNTIIGSNAYKTATSGGTGVYIGAQAAAGASGSHSNVVIGYNAASLGTLSGGRAVAIGLNAGKSLSTGVSNTLIGDDAAISVSSGGYNSMLGNTSAKGLTTGGYNSGIGAGTIFDPTSSYQVALGADAECTAARQMTLGSDDTAGSKSLTEIRPGTDNACTLGSATNRFSTVYCNAVDTNGGLVDGVDVTTLAVGTQGFTNPVDDTNMAAGTTAGDSLTTGAERNVLIGKDAGTAMTTAVHNTAVGYQAGLVATGGYNTLVGTYAGSTVSTGTGNVVVGTAAAGAAEINTGSSNVIVGSNSGLTTGDGCCALGKATAMTAGGDYQISIGYQATCDAANQCTIGGLNTGLSVTEVRPGITNHTDLGSSGRKWKDLYLSGDVLTDGDINMSSTSDITLGGDVKFGTSLGSVTHTIPATITTTANISEMYTVCDTSSAGFTVTMPVITAAIESKIYTILLETGGNTLTIARGGTDTINLPATTTITFASTKGHVRLLAVGTHWYLL